MFKAMGMKNSQCILILLTGLIASCGTAKIIQPTRGNPGIASDVQSTRQPRTMRVRPGDTIYAIGRRTGIRPADLIAWNRLSDPNHLDPGQVLQLSAMDQPVHSAVTVSAATPSARPSRSPTVAAPLATQHVTSAKPATTWRWPATGSIVGRFSPDDQTRQGIDIAGTEGEPVLATAKGVVVYSGTGLMGYGELIIIKHDERWLSAYGHNRQRFVSEGQTVAAGQLIARMGRTGTVRTMLHFEIRQNGKPVDPLQYLPPVSQ